jgi:hypothetical protein
MGGLKAQECSRKVCLGRMIAGTAREDAHKLRVLKDVVGESGKAGVALADAEVEPILGIVMQSKEDLKKNLEQMMDQIDLLHHTNHAFEV